MPSTAPGERTTAAISALVAAAILGAVVTAQQARVPSDGPAARLRSLESDLRFQLDLAFRADGGVLKARTSQLDQTLDAWRRSPQAAGDYALVTQWLSRGIANTLPGSSGELPPQPEFSQPPPQGVAAARPQPPSPVRAAQSPTEPAPRPQVAITPPRSAATPKQSKFVDPPRPIASGVRPASQPLLAGDQSANRARAAAAVPPVLAPAKSPKQATAAAPSPASEHTIAVSQATRSQQPVALPPTGAKAQTTPISIEVNLAELNARIAGYHQGLREIEAAVVNDGDDFEPAKLTGWVDKLEQLAREFRFVELYYNTLTPRERQAVATPRSYLPAVELVARQRTRPTESGGDFLSAFDPSVGESDMTKRLDALIDSASN